MKFATLSLAALLLAAPLPALAADGGVPPESERRPAPAAPVGFGQAAPSGQVAVEGVVVQVWEDEILLRGLARSYLVDLWPRSAYELDIRPGERLRVVGMRDEESLIAVRLLREDGSEVTLEAF